MLNMTHTAELVTKNYSVDMHLKAAFEYELQNVLEVREIPEGADIKKIVTEYLKTRVKTIIHDHN